MAVSTVQGLRSEAKARGLRWATVEQAYQELRAAEWQRREHANNVRQQAWISWTATSPGCWDFWRHGFAGRLAKRVEAGDLTRIPGYDSFAKAIACDFPEYQGDDGTQRLWDFLLSPYDRYPSREQLLRRAIDLVERNQPTSNSEADDDPVPF